jgi:hypothetical protein
MPLWLYALTTEPLPEAPSDGAAGEALVGLKIARWAASATPSAATDRRAEADATLFVVAGDVTAALQPSEATLRAHDRTVRALADLLDPLLPVRFGQTVASVADLTALLAPRRIALLAALGEVAGCVQVTLRFPSPDEPFGRKRTGVEEDAEPADEPSPPDRALTASNADAAEPSRAAGPGTRYLHARRESARAAATPPPPEAGPLLARLAPLVRAERVAPARPPFAATVYHLVERRRLGDYRAALAAAAAALDPPPVASGPWPAWAFAPGLVE